MKKKLLHLFLSLVMILSIVPQAAFAGEAVSEEETVSITLSAEQTAKLYAVADTNQENDLLASVEPVETSSAPTYKTALACGEYRLVVFKDVQASSAEGGEEESPAPQRVGSLKLVVTAEGEPTQLGNAETRNSFVVHTISGIKATNERWVKGTDYQLDLSVRDKSMTYDRSSELCWDSVLGEGTALCYDGDTAYASYIPDAQRHPEYFKVNVSETFTFSKKALSAEIPTGVLVTVEAPEGSTVSMGNFHTYFIFDFYERLSQENGNNNEWSFLVPRNVENVFIRVQHPEGITYWTYGKYTENATVAVTNEQLYIGSDINKTSTFRFEKNAYDLADIYLNLNEKGYKNLELGESFELNTFRSWLAIESTTNAQLATPDTHYQVIDPETGAPSDVLTVSPDLKNSAVATVTANKPGVAAVLVSYDSMYFEQAYTAGAKEKLFSAIWPEKTGIAIFSVAADGSSIETNMEMNEGWNTSAKEAGGKLDAEHDVLFYLDGSAGATYSFKPEDGCTVSVAHPVYTEGVAGYEGFTTEGVLAAEDGTVTLSGLMAGRHIVKITKGELSSYQIITAAPYTYTAKNNESGKLVIENGRKLAPIYAGDVLSFSFKGLTNTVEKHNGAYNFNLNVVAGDGTTQFGVRTGGMGSYDFSAKEQGVEVTVPADMLEGGSWALRALLGVNGLGSPYGNHRVTTYRDGRARDFTAVQQHGFLSDIQLGTILIDKIPVYRVKFESTPESVVVIKDKTGAELSSTAGIYTLFGGLYSLELTAEGYLPIKESLEVSKALEAYLDAESGIVSLSRILKPLPKGAWDGKTLKEPVLDEGVYQISTGQELAWFADAVNGGQPGIKGKLTADIELSGIPWTPIGTGTAIAYTGSFDGDGHRIHNLNVQNGSIANAGLFGVLGANAKVEKLGIESGEVNGGKGVGGIAGHVSDKSSKIDSCFNKASITGTGHVGGIVGIAVANSTVTNCYNTGEVKATAKSNDYAGGIIACSINQNLAINAENCYNVGTISNASAKTTRFGGITGSLSNQTKSKNSYYLSGCAGEGKGKGGTAKTADELCKLATTLGSAFISDPNGGYPKLLWESKDFAAPQLASFSISGTNGTINKNHSGSEEDPYIITVELPEGSSKEEQLADFAASVALPELVAEPNVTEAQDYTQDLLFKLSLGLSPASWYKVKLSVKAPAEPVSPPAGPVNPPTEPDFITVSFRLIGAELAERPVNFSEDSYLPAYVNWVKTVSYRLPKNSMVYDLTVKALAEHGIGQIGAENGYISTLYAPSQLGGYALSEFTNGKGSGWMYTVNGTHPNRGLRDWELKDGDRVVWHYVNDYRYEVADWMGGERLGDGSLYSGWLAAADVVPVKPAEQTPLADADKDTPKPEETTKSAVENPFVDIEGNWAAEAIVYAYKNDIMRGVSDGSFQPAGTVSRAMFVTALYRLEKEPLVSGESPFSDVEKGQWYTDAFSWAADSKLVSGYSDGSSGFNDDITREQLAVLLYRYARLVGKLGSFEKSELSAYSDASSISDFAKEAMEWANAAGLIKGRSENALEPKGTATRAEMAALLQRFIEGMAK